MHWRPNNGLIWRRPGRSLFTLRLLTSFIIVSTLLYAILPHDNAIRLSLRFNAQKLTGFLTGPLKTDHWLYEDPAFPVDWSCDVAIILKTGFGTQERARAFLEVLPVGISPESVLVVGDFQTELIVADEDFPQPMTFEVHDVVADVVRNHGSSYPRGAKYRTLAATIAAGEHGLARNLSRSVGWELDAMKFIPALQLAFQAMHDKKWYILVDDDTYLIQPSLDVVLGHYDPSVPYYLGNAVGDFRQRFAHGGSSTAISNAAMSALLSQKNAHALVEAKEASLTETWGDRLLATALLRLGIHIEEQASRFFNGEQPWASRLRGDRLCVPVATFHRLSAGEMREVGRVLARTAYPVLWVDIWDMYGAPSLEEYRERPFRIAWDHVGQLDEHTTTLGGAESATGCLRSCEAHGQCLAWTWEEAESLCHLSPWVTVGTEARGRVSGLHIDRVWGLADLCR